MTKASLVRMVDPRNNVVYHLNFPDFLQREVQFSKSLFRRHWNDKPGRDSANCLFKVPDPSRLKRRMVRSRLPVLVLCASACFLIAVVERVDNIANNSHPTLLSNEIDFGGSAPADQNVVIEHYTCRMRMR